MMMDGTCTWIQEIGDGPIVAVALHDGHDLREEVRARMALTDEERRREEDPFTGEWTTIAPTRLVARRSRFEFDLNRPREGAVYVKPEDAWGLQVWRELPEEDLVAESLDLYDAFYENAMITIGAIVERHGHVVVLDLHSYNHRRGGPDAPPADVEGNPQINLGTGTMDRERWAPLVDRFVEDLRAFDYPGGALDVRENVRFRGGHFPKWVHETFPEEACALAIEAKKFFMDEWTGAPDPAHVDAIRRALASTTDGLLEELARR